MDSVASKPVQRTGIVCVTRVTLVSTVRTSCRVRRMRVATAQRIDQRTVVVDTRVNADRVSVVSGVKRTSTTVPRMVTCCVQVRRVKTVSMATTVTASARADVVRIVAKL